jgi:hypothetical protein
VVAKLKWRVVLSRPVNLLDLCIPLTSPRFWFGETRSSKPKMRRERLSRFLYLLFAITFRGARSEYGFHFPRATDQLWLGQTINITWDSQDDHVKLTLVFDEWTDRLLKNTPIVITGK